RRVGGQVRAVNVEKGMFGIIDGVNSLHDPLIWKVLRSPGEVIFSNILVTEGGHVYWNGMDGECPPKGVNFAGEWFAGKRDGDGKEIPPSHKNARFTFDLHLLDNLDPHLDDPEGVPVAGIIYGARDSDTWVPVEEAFDWEHGIVTKAAALESETTAATLGQEGVRVFNPMSNLDFLSIPIGRYIQDNLDFGAGLVRPPRVFSVNYFLRGQNGEFLNDRADKRVWLKWMELRAHDDVGAIAGPTGLLPRYEDLRRLFKQVLGRDYPIDAYREQFAVRVPESIAKIDRLLKIYSERVLDTPARLFELLSQQRQRLQEARSIHGDRIAPDALN
ncbi:MAG: phosphoenolpyruvate carboxykinase (GTP), partial [Calditrichaeota bacterium]|nr:phosphoenolpyruvate carboxykinase (GTP) [Calditrichota bacterium]